MSDEKKKEKRFIKTLEYTGLNYNDALILFTLIKSGKRGCVVNELKQKSNMKRTTIYSILDKLIKLGFVTKGGKSTNARNATIYTANQPNAIFEKIIMEKKDELEKIINIQQKHSKYLEQIYKKGTKDFYFETELILLPYIKPLLEKGWKILPHLNKKKKMPFFDYQIYESKLIPPNAKYLKICSFHLFLFDYNIEKDESTLKFFTNQIKKKSKKSLQSRSGFDHFKFVENEIKYFNKSFFSFTMKVHINDLKQSKFFSLFKKNLKDISILNSDIYIEGWKSIIIPVRNKLFFLWAESEEILNEMMEPILKNEDSLSQY